MAMQLVKKADGYKIFKRGDERYAVKDAFGRSVNGEEKVKVLLGEGLITVTAPAPKAEEPVPAEEGEAEAAAEE